MSNAYSLEDLKADVDKEFAPVVITYAGEEFRLRHLFRLSDDERKAVFGALDLVGAEEGTDSTEADAEAMAAMAGAVWAMLEALPEGGKGRKFVELLGRDLALGMKIVGIYTEKTQPGEAESSPS